MRRCLIFFISTAISILVLLVLTLNAKEYTTTSADGTAINYYVYGKSDPTLVFVHGFASERSDWFFQKNYFSKNHKVVIIELAGFGKSENNRKNWTIEAFAEDVASVFKHAKIKKAVLIGQSMGGGVILEAEKRIPDRIIGLVPVDVFQNVESKVAEKDIQKRVDGLMKRIESGDRKWLEGAFKRKLKPAVIENILHYYKTCSKIGWRESAIDFIHWRSNKLTKSLMETKSQIYCINSNRIFTDIATARKYAPSFKVKIVENSGHPVMLDAPEDFNKALSEIIKEFTGSKY